MKNRSNLALKKIFLISVGIFLTLKLHAQICEHTYDSQSSRVMPTSFSPDNTKLAVEYNKSIEIWDLKLMKQTATFNVDIDNIYNLVWTIDNKKVIAHLGNEKSEQFFVLLDIEKNTSSTITSNEKLSLGGFIDANTIWYQKDDNTFGTVKLSETNNNNEITLLSDWETKVNGKLVNITFDPILKRFLLFYRDADQNYIGGLIKKGEATLEPLPKDCRKALKNAWLVKSNNRDAILFKIFKKEEGLILNIHTLQTKPVDQMPTDINRIIGLSLTHYLETFHEVIVEEGNFNITDRLSSYNFCGDYQITILELKNGVEDYCFSNDMTMFAKRIVCGNNNVQIHIYNIGNDLSKATIILLPKALYPEIQAFNEYVLSHTDQFEQNIQKTLKEEYLDNGWELVPNLKPITLVGTKQVTSNPSESFQIEPGYQYLALRVDYGLLYKMEGKELPGDELPTVLEISGIAQDDFYWREKEVNWCCLGFTAEQYFHTSNSTLTGEISIRVDDSNKMVKNITSEAVNLYILRKKDNYYFSDSYDYESQKVTREKMENSSNSSTSSENICAPQLNDDFALKHLKELGSDWISSTFDGSTILNSTIGKGDVDLTFSTPMNHSGAIYIMVITNGPCNKMEILDISGYSLTEQIFVGRPDEFDLKNIPSIKELRSFGFQFFTYKIDHTAVQGRTKKYQIKLIGGETNKEVQGVTVMNVFYF